MWRVFGSWERPREAVQTARKLRAGRWASARGAPTAGTAVGGRGKPGQGPLQEAVLGIRARRVDS